MDKLTTLEALKNETIDFRDERSWQQFHEEGIDKFLNGEFAGDYEQSLYDEFKKYLPSTPPWKRGGPCGGK